MTEIDDLPAWERLKPLVTKLAGSTQFSLAAIRSAVAVLAEPTDEADGAPWTEDEITQALPTIIETAARVGASLAFVATLFRQTVTDARKAAGL